MLPLRAATCNGDLPDPGSRQLTIPPGIIPEASCPAAWRQNSKLSVSSLAVAKWMRNGNNTASVVAASAAVQDHGAAASCAGVWLLTSEELTLIDGAGTNDLGRLRRTNCDKSCSMFSKFWSMVGCLTMTPAARVSSPRRGLPMRSRTSWVVSSSLERR